MSKFLYVYFILLFLNTSYADPDKAKPKLIIEIIVDQLRADLPELVIKHPESKAFRMLTKKAIWYHNAQHNHANTETVVGHATIATGANPSQHGMISNEWYDPKLEKFIYSVNDPDTYQIGTDSVVRSKGCSPKNLAVTTFTDHLQESNPASKVYAVSAKDRAAIPLAGHKGKAFWFSKESGNFVTSSYYYPKTPKLLTNWNKKKIIDQYAGKAWQLKLKPNKYNSIDNRDFENPVYKKFGKVFQHEIGTFDTANKYSILLRTPFIDEITIDFAKDIIEQEALGSDSNTDFLGISLSATDYIGHLFGADSLEAEDNLLRLDLLLSNFFDLIDSRVGLNNTLIVISSDHGIPNIPKKNQEYALSQSYITESDIINEKLNELLLAKFGVGNEVIKAFKHQELYLNHRLIKSKAIDLNSLSSFITDYLNKLNQVEIAIRKKDLLKRKIINSKVLKKVYNTLHPERSGDIYIVYKENIIPHDNSDNTIITHGSPWDYDTKVPLIFYGSNFKAKNVQRNVNTTELAASLSALLGINASPAADSVLLNEILE